MDKPPTIIENHDTTWHDGGVAIRTRDGDLIALASERIGPREKHSGNSKLAYEYLKRRYPETFLPVLGIDDRFAETRSPPVATSRHHLNHAACAYYGSGFEDAAVIVVDGQGPDDGVLKTTTIWHGSQGELREVESLHQAPPPFAAASIGHFYTAVGALAGMETLHDEGKTMGLAAYGRPSKVGELISGFASSEADGSYVIDHRFTEAVLGNTLGATLFDWPPPSPEVQRIWEELASCRRFSLDRPRPTQDDADIAFAGQAVVERIMLGLARRAKMLTASRRLCLAGGVALNCVANGKIRAAGEFDEVFVAPAAGDDGQAIGKVYLNMWRRGIAPPRMDTVYLGPPPLREELDRALGHLAPSCLVSSSAADTLGRVALLLAEGGIVGCCRGRSELGPRALGHRSIFADPRRADTRERLNFLIKRRDWYRPVAPMVLEAEAARYFELDGPSPFMTFAVRARAKTASLAPAAVHVDGTARVQTINAGQEPFLFELLGKFGALTGLPMLINTSFNLAGQPIVETYDDAITAAKSLGLQALVLEDCLLELE